MKMRSSEQHRKSSETCIDLFLNVDGHGESQIQTGCGFLNHMLEAFAKHSRFDLKVKCQGDVEVDYHHTTEDIGVVLGNAFKASLGERLGIKRFGNMILPMDEALVLAAVDISGRGMCLYDIAIPAEKVGDFDTELVAEFFSGFCRVAGINMHLKQMAGSNSHHIIEAAFKAAAKALKEAVEIDEAYALEVPSTKGILD